MPLISFETKLARFRAAQARRKEREERWRKARARKLARIRARRQAQCKRREAREAREELRFVMAYARAVLKGRKTWRRLMSAAVKVSRPTPLLRADVQIRSCK